MAVSMYVNRMLVQIAVLGQMNLKMVLVHVNIVPKGGSFHQSAPGYDRFVSFFIVIVLFNFETISLCTFKRERAFLS